MKSGLSSETFQGKGKQNFYNIKKYIETRILYPEKTYFRFKDKVKVHLNMVKLWNSSLGILVLQKC